MQKDFILIVSFNLYLFFIAMYEEMAARVKDRAARKMASLSAWSPMAQTTRKRPRMVVAMAATAQKRAQKDVFYNSQC